MALTQQRSERMRRLPTMLVATLALLAAVLVVPLVLVPPAEAYIYWTIPGSIGRAAPDGKRVDQSFIAEAGNPVGIGVDDAHVYWANLVAGAIGRADLDGSNLDHDFITGEGSELFSVRGALAIGGSHVYWALAPPLSEQPMSRIGRANLDGTGFDPDFLTVPGTVYGLAADATHVYWTDMDSGAVGRANVDGTGIDPTFITVNGSRSSDGIAVDAEHIYWGASECVPFEGCTGVIYRANIDGTEVDKLLTTGPYGLDVFGVAVEPEHLYWTAGYAIGRAKLDGTDPDPEFIPVPTAGYDPYAFDLAVDPDTEVAARVSARRNQRRTTRNVRVRVKVKAKERLTAKASGKVKVNPIYKLRPSRIELDPSEARTLKLRPRKRAQAGSIAAALRQGEKATARLTVKLTDEAGNRKSEKLRVKLRSQR